MFAVYLKTIINSQTLQWWGNFYLFLIVSGLLFLQETDDKKDKAKKKVLVKTIELPIEARTSGNSTNELNTYMEQEVSS